MVASPDAVPSPFLFLSLGAMHRCYGQHRDSITEKVAKAVLGKHAKNCQLVSLLAQAGGTLDQHSLTVLSIACAGEMKTALHEGIWKTASV